MPVSAVTCHKNWQLVQVDILDGQLPQLYQQRQGSGQLNGEPEDVIGIDQAPVVQTADAQAGERGKVAHTVWNSGWPWAVLKETRV